jgi:Ser/Thr protein kinase RdoA (MazF antagonist)
MQATAQPSRDIYVATMESLVNDMDSIAAWAAETLGQPVQLVDDAVRTHPGKVSRLYRLRTVSPAKDYVVKSYERRVDWAHEVHAYEQWTPALGPHAPTMLAAQDGAPPTILLTLLPGGEAQGAPLSTERERDVWRAAGHALATLHALPPSRSFGPCDRSGVPTGMRIDDAPGYVTGEFEDWIERGERARCISAAERAFVRSMGDLASVFAGERPTPSHRDWCPANWIVDDVGAWIGAIDWEFAYPDVRAADVSRYPSWEWMDRPDLVEALDEGYRALLTPVDPAQRRVARALYALTAIVWGRETGYAGFEREGHGALSRLGAQR